MQIWPERRRISCYTTTYTAQNVEQVNACTRLPHHMPTKKKKKKVEGRLFLNWRWNQFKRNQDLVTKSPEFSVHCLFSANSSQGEPTPSESGQLKKKKICNWICCTFTMMEWVFIYTSTGERKISLIVLVALELVRAHLNSPKETKDHGNN